MANSRPMHLPTTIDLEKGENGVDSSLTRSSSSSAQHVRSEDPHFQTAFTASSKDLEALPNEVSRTGATDIKMSRMSTRGSWRDIVSVATRISTKSSWKDPGPPPDGGLIAWTQVAMGHLVIMNTWGFINSFGVFQTYYVEALNRSPSDIAWVGSIQVFLLFFISTWTGRLTDAGYFKQMIILGTILQSLGLFMASLSTQYWQLFLAQGVCLGLGNGCLFCPIVSLVSTYFSTKRSLAIGIVACGSATGGLVFPAMVQQLLPKVGFGWTLRAVGFVQMVCLVLCIIFAKQRLPPRRAGPIVEWTAFTELPYSLFAAGIFFIFWGVYFAFYYIGSYARDVIDVSYNESINLILVLNGVGAVGRLIPNYFADLHTGPLNMMIPVSALSAIAVYCWIPVSVRGELYAWAVVYGLFGAAIQSLFPAVLASLTTELRKRGVRMGMIFSIVSFAVLTGPPIEGALIQKGNGLGRSKVVGIVKVTGARKLAGYSNRKSGSLQRICMRPQDSPHTRALRSPNILFQFYRPFADNFPHLNMSAYSSAPPSSYDLHSSAADNSNQDLLTQQQQQQHHHHHRGAPPSQSYQFDPHQEAQDQTYATHANGHGEESQQLTPGAAEKQRWKGNRLRKACDSCSIRKVRCDESGPPCLACSALEIPCTFERPSRRRGPPNRHAEALKKQKVDSPLPTGGFSSPTSPNNIAETLASFSSHAVLSAESICPFPILELLVDDYFTYIHPLVPFPHEPSFRAAFKHREDLNNSSFLALLSSMIGALVASFPRRPRLHLKKQNRETLFPNSMSLVERCHKVAVEARGAGYLDKDLTVYDAATSYLLALVAAYTYNMKQCRLYFGETLTILRVIGVNVGHNPKNATGQTSSYDATRHTGQHGEPVDFIRQEIGRRIFWILFVGIRSSQQLGAIYEIIIPPPTPSEPYPPLPMEVDDQYIYVSHVDHQPANVVSELTGFNLNIQIYRTCTPLNTMELAYGIDEVFDWNRQKRVLENCLEAVRHALDNAPRELMLKPGSQPGEFEGENGRRYMETVYHFGESDGLGSASGYHDGNLEVSRRAIQYEIQKANIYVSQLGTRSYLVEKYWNLLDAYESKVRSRDSSATSPGTQSSPGVMASGLDAVMRGLAGTGGYEMVESHMSTEREIIVKDLLKVLGSISKVNMEPNGGSFINKVRQIASTLLDTPRNRKGPLAIRAEEYLAQFLDILTKLEHVSPPRMLENGHSNIFARSEEEVEEEELRNWADLRECQMRFAANEGVFTDF